MQSLVRMGVDSRRRDALTAVFGAWLMIGLLVDGYVHNTRGDELESFLTPWHGLLYSGFLASALWITGPMFTVTGPLRERVTSLPDGYALGALGVLIFGLGGMADSVWHTLLGIEVDIDALLSPPHLVLFTGAILILTTPARAAWRHPEHSPDLRTFGPALASITLSTLLVGFFFMYSSGLFDFHATTAFARLFEPGAVFADDPFLYEVLTGLGVVARLLTTVVLLVPLLSMTHRWELPFGAVTILFTSFAAFMLVLAQFRLPEMVVAAALAGLAGDLLVRRLRPGPHRPGAVRALAVAVPVVLWLAHMSVLALDGDLGWPFAIWGGTVLFAAGTGYALSLLSVPPASPRARTAG